MKLQMYGLDITDTSKDPLDFELPPSEEIEEALDSMILSASGWRGVFAADGSEESDSPAIRESHRFIIGCVALAFFDWLNLDSRRNDGAIEVVVGTDTRPTGPTIADVIIAVLLGSGARVRYTSIAAAPEIMAHARTIPEIDAFVFVSASHNPIGHNGLKFGRDTGGVLGGVDAASLREVFTGVVSIEARERTWERLLECRRTTGREAVYKATEREKQLALDSYLSFLHTVAAGPVSVDAARAIFQNLHAACQSDPLGILGELNGSARTTSIDATFLASLGLRTKLINDQPGAIQHRIVPEGESLDPCRNALEEIRSHDASFMLGYVPDNDGDRGNLVYYDEVAGASRTLHAQEVFALSCLAELSYLASIDESEAIMERTAIVVNGPTSMRVERIAGLFGAQVIRCEVGESNGVDRADELRSEGWRVRILGEGSNGGTIIHPSSVRDPLGTIASVVKLLRLPSSEPHQSPLAIWSARVGLERECKPSVTAVLDTLPRFTTTGAYEDRAIMRIAVPDHAGLKAEYERRFPEAWESNRAEMHRRFGFHSWRVINYEGTKELPGIGNRDSSGPQRGGLKIVFSNSGGIDTGFIWMRGSATEPVFRVLADIEGVDAEGEAYLLDWHKSLIRSALGE